MSLLRQAWYRWIDRELDRAITLPEPGRLEPSAWNARIGAEGERLAAKHLWRAGKKVLYRNYRPREGGEVDLVYRDHRTLVFAEVKTRTQGEFGDPARAVDASKEALVIRGANAWLRELGQPEILFRFDIIEVLLHSGEPPRIRVAEDAFTTPQRDLGI